MAKLTIIWTALPNGLKRDGTTQRLRLAVFVSPRLQLDAGQPNGKLEQFPEMVTWPARMTPGRLSMHVIVDDDAAHPIPTEIVTKPAPDPALWAALFDRTTFVRSHEFPIQREPVSSYETNTLQRTLYRGFGEVGQASPYRLPDKPTLKRAFRHVFDAVAGGAAPAAIGTYDVATMSAEQLAAEHKEIGENLLRSDERSSFDAKLARAIELAGALAREQHAAAVPIVPRTDSQVSAIAQFVAFHRRPARRRVDAPSRAERDADADRIDFHQALSALGEYPDLLRRLGLVIDLEITGRVPDSLSGDATLKRLRVEPRFADSGLTSTAYTPNTKYLLDLRLTGSPLPFSIFAAAPRRAEAPHAAPLSDPEIVGGLLNLGIQGPDAGRQFNLVQTDIDGAMTKVLNTVNAIALDEQRPTLPIDKPDATGTPAFRSSGISLVRSDHVGALIEGIRRAEAHQSALAGQRRADFFAEDLVRGYRIDMRQFPANTQFNASGQPLGPPPPWLSLHRRLGRYVARPGGPGSVTLNDIADEGFIQPAFVQDPDAGTPAAAPVNPIYVPESMFHWKGWSLSTPPPANPVDVTPQSVFVERVAPIGLPQLDVDFTTPPGSLPRLRFGSFYEVRARTVDLAGNGLSVEEADRVVTALEAQGSQTPVLSEQPDKFRYRRFEPIPPPEPVLREVLTAGETIDVMVIRSNGSTAAAYAASLGDPKYKAVSERHIVPPKAALTTIETHGKLDGAFGPAGTPGSHYNLCRREGGTLNDNGIINIATGNRELFPNVPIPNPAGGTALVPNGIRFVPVPPGPGGYTVHYEAQLRVPYLPDPLARGAALFGLPGVDGVSGELEGGDLKYSTREKQVLAIPATRELGFVTKIDFGPSDKWPDALPLRLKLDELASDAFPVRPSWSRATRELTVKLAPGQTQPIWISSFPAPEDVDLLGLYAWWRSQAPTSSDPKHFLKMAQHGALSMLSPPRKLLLVHAVQRPVAPPIESTDSPLRAVRFENGTTAYIAGAFKIHSASTAKVDLVAEWHEQGEGPDDTTTHQLKTHVFEVPIPPTAPASPNVKPIATFDPHTERLEFQTPTGSTVPAERYLARHEFGDTKYRRLTCHLMATTRFREFFPDSITGNPDNLTKTFTKRSVVFPSSARPPAPEISYIVPSFGWLVDRIGARVTQSMRRGGGLRVYLGEKWYASGAGEQLAVVEAPGLRQWGLDPVHVSSSSAVATAITPDAPPAAGLSFNGQVHPYDVRFDPEQRLWYSDITFNVGDTYFPFRQLTLARYQANSLPGLHVSPLVHAGMHQLAPDRAVTLGYSDPTSADPNRRVKISVTATPTSAVESIAAQPTGAPIVEVVLEERDVARRNWDADLGWSPAEPSKQPVVDSPPSQSRLWIGHVLLPREPGTKQRRLVIREVEIFPTGASPPGQAWIGETAGATRRVVYADTIPLD